MTTEKVHPASTHVPLHSLKNTSRTFMKISNMKRSNSFPPILIVSMSLLLLLVLSSVVVVPASSSSSSGLNVNSYHSYNYDMTTPMFTPDGRLLQVEYASNAPTLQSSPLVAFSYKDESLGEYVTIIATTTTTTAPLSSALATSDNNEDDQGEKGKLLSTDKHIGNGKKIGQKRIIEMSILNNNDDNNLGGGLVVGLSGVLSDNIALLKIIREDHLDTWKRQYGLYRSHSHIGGAFVSSTTMTGAGSYSQNAGIVKTTATTALSLPTSAANRIAKVVGDACQRHTFGGGIRPYGASFLICAVDPLTSLHDNGSSPVSIYTTNPSGAVMKHVSGQKSDNETKSTKGNTSPLIVVLGGEMKTQRRIKQDIANSFLKTSSGEEEEETTESSSLLPKAIRAISSTLINVQNLDNKKFSFTTTTSEKDKNKENKSNQKKIAEQMQISIITQSRGVHYVDTETLCKLMEERY